MSWLFHDLQLKNTMSTTTDVYTFRDYLNAVDEARKAHLLDGMILMESPAATRHEELQSFLASIVTVYVAEKQLGKVFGSHAAFRLKGRNAVEPDLSVVVRKRLPLIMTNYVNGPPDLAVEIISKGTRRLDYERKLPAYEAAGTPEVWVIDYLREHAEFYLFKGNQLTAAKLARDHFFDSRVVPGLRLDVRWLWGDPLPKPTTILRKLLG
jgi:Uma2 family endonuclease